MAKKTEKKNTDVKLKSNIKPRVTEKAATAISAKSGVYTFEIAKGMNKAEVAKAVKSTYSVSPVKVNISNTPGKTMVRKGKKVHTGGIRKAMVYLKTGDKIEF